MIDLSNLAHQQHHHVGLPQEFQLDLQWWASFLPTWNGKSILHQPDLQHVIMADASGTWGFGSQRQMVSDPAAKGVGRVPHCCKGTGSGGHGFSVIAPPRQSTTALVRSDNRAVVAALPSGTALDPVLMHILRCLHFFLAHHDIRLVARHIAGINNTVADALSRDNLPVFSNVNHRPTPRHPHCHQHSCSC